MNVLRRQQVDEMSHLPALVHWFNATQSTNNNKNNVNKQSAGV